MTVMCMSHWLLSCEKDRLSCSSALFVDEGEILPKTFDSGTCCVVNWAGEFLSTIVQLSAFRLQGLERRRLGYINFAISGSC